MDELAQLAQQVGVALQAAGLSLATAESCTGGWVAQEITAIAGSSQWFERGFVTYSNEAKQDMLGVAPDTLARYGAVSPQVARAMVLGALGHSRAQVALAITGIAGPGGGSTEKPVGTVCFAWARQGQEPRLLNTLFSGDRLAVRQQAVRCALLGILTLLKPISGDTGNLSAISVP